MKTIVLCADGTGNSATKGRGTNVFKLFEAVDFNGHLANPFLHVQVGFYDDGVGTQGTFVKRLVGSAGAWGFGANVKQLYAELCRVYAPGDRIFLFGFSRGALTVRHLAGMIGACGVLNGERFRTTREFHDAVSAAYVAFRAGFDTVVMRMLVRRDAATAIERFRDTFEPRTSVAVDFIGVWDTVAGLSSFVNRVIYQLNSPSIRLGPHVRRACHALSIDDDRVAFEPTLWEADDSSIEQPWAPSNGDRRIEQVWFAGVHSNVGGGYQKQGMSLVAFDWMLAHAARAGLRLQPVESQLLRAQANGDDTLYEPRTGLGKFYRWAPRDITAYCEKTGIRPRIHLSVVERIARGIGDYTPGNIPREAAVVHTPQDDRSRDEMLGRRARAAEHTIHEVHADRPHLLNYVRVEIAVVRASYWFFVAGWLLLIAGAAGPVIRALGRVASSSASTAALTERDLLFELLGLMMFVVAEALARWSRRRMSDVFSAFWRSHQRDLRDALERALSDERNRSR